MPFSGIRWTNKHQLYYFVNARRLFSRSLSRFRSSRTGSTDPDYGTKAYVLGGGPHHPHVALLLPGFVLPVLEPITFTSEYFQEISRAHILEPNGADMRQRKIVWAAPAFAEKCVYLRNDTEVVCVSLAE